jgi:hypothetical protein
MGAMKSRLWPNKDAERPDVSPTKRITKYIATKYNEITLDKTSIHYTYPILILTGRLLNTDLFELVLNRNEMCERVESIELRDCECVQRIPAAIQQYTALTELDLRRNGITEISWSLIKLKRTLTRLNLSHNVIEHVPRFIGRLVLLTDLDLSENAILDVPSTLLQLTDLITLRLEHNPNLNFPSEVVCQRGKGAVFEALESRKQREDIWRYARTYGEGQIERNEPQSLQEICYTCIARYGLSKRAPGLLPRVLSDQVQREANTYFKVAKCSACLGYFSSEDTFDRHVCCR